MANMEVNKAFAAVLTAGIAFMVTGLVGQQLVHVERPHESAIQIGDVAAVDLEEVAHAHAGLQSVLHAGIILAQT